ncbi:MAG: DUF6465 family protein [Lachnospiraceae bacterium]|nr:DUF6465 family protein [Lachnospiraceae bacterium]
MAEEKKPVAVAKVVKKAEPAKKETPVKKVAAVKKAEPAKKAEAVKKAEPAKKAAPAKKTAAKKTTKKVVVKENIVFQFNGTDISEKDLIKGAKAAYKAAGNKDAVKEVTVYVNCNEGMCYPVVNGVSIEEGFSL